MAHVNVTIAGKTYRMACGEGEEAHLSELAAGFDARVAEMRRAFGEIGDMRLHVMAAITVSDELAELKRRIAAQEQEVARLRAITESFEADRDAERTRIAGGVESAAERIERVAKMIAGAPG